MQCANILFGRSTLIVLESQPQNCSLCRHGLYFVKFFRIGQVCVPPESTFEFFVHIRICQKSFEKYHLRKFSKLGGNNPCYLAQFGKIPPIPAASKIFNTLSFFLGGDQFLALTKVEEVNDNHLNITKRQQIQNDQLQFASDISPH